MPTPAPTGAPTPTPTIEPTPDPISTVAAARLLPDDTTVTIVGILTTSLGALESGRTAFVQDATGGIALYLDAVVVASIPAGTEIAVTGAVSSRFDQRTLRVAEADVEALGFPGVPSALASDTGAATEPLEGLRLAVEGVVLSGSDNLSDGLAVSIDDGSGPVRLILTPSALAGRVTHTGDVLQATGPLGQRDSTGSGTTGYRLYVVDPADLAVTPPPTPTPAPTPTPTAQPTAVPTPTATPAPTTSPAPTATTQPTPTPTAVVTPSPIPSATGSTIASARALAIGTTVSVRGVVTAEAGRLGTPPLFAIADASGGLVVRLPDGVSAQDRGQLVDVRGTLADPYGQLEIRPPATGLGTVGTGSLPAAVVLAGATLGESVEGRLVVLTATVAEKPAKASSGDLTVVVETSDGARVKVAADASSGLTSGSFAVGATYRFTGVAGQRASRKGALDGYRLWTRDPADVQVIAQPTPTPSPTPSPSPTAKPKPHPSTTPKPSSSGVKVVAIATALRTTDRDVAIEGVVTAPASLLDATGRRIVVQDATGAIELLIAKDIGVPTVGARVRAVGRVGTAYGSPRLRATLVDPLGRSDGPSPLVLHAAPTNGHAWRLVSISGRVDDVKKLGDRWRAELVVGAARVVVVGQPGAAIPVAAIVEGRTATVIGIVRRAYPTASDKRPSILPRGGADIRLSGAVTAGAGGAGRDGTAGSGGSGSSSTTGGPARQGTGWAPTASVDPAILAAPTADLIDLADLDGRLVRVGGLVRDLHDDGFDLDDGTAIGTIVLTGDAAAWLPLIEPDDAINVVGRVTTGANGPTVVVDDPAAIVLGADPVAAAGAMTASAAAAEPSTDPAMASPDAHPRLAGFGADLGALPGAGAGLVTLLLVTLASVALTLVRRRQARHLLASRVAVRLAAMTGAPGATLGAPPAPAAADDRPVEAAERGPSVATRA